MHGRVCATIYSILPLNRNIERKGYANSYTPNGLTVTAIIQGNSIGLKIRGNVAQSLGTASDYAACGAIPQLVPLMTQSIIKRVILFGTCQGQLYVESGTGLVKIGNTRLLTTGESCNIPAGVQIYVDEGFVV